MSTSQSLYTYYIELFNRNFLQYYESFNLTELEKAIIIILAHNGSMIRNDVCNLLGFEKFLSIQKKHRSGKIKKIKITPYNRKRSTVYDALKRLIEK